MRSVSKVSMMGCELVGWLVGKEKEVEGTWNGWKYGVFFLFFSFLIIILLRFLLVFGGMFFARGCVLWLLAVCGKGALRWVLSYLVLGPAALCSSTNLG